MLPQVVTSGVGFGAQQACKTFFSGVNATDVLFELGFGDESAFAEGAAVGSFPSVDGKVEVVLVLALEQLAADRARILGVGGVRRLHVAAEAVGGQKRPSASLAKKRSLEIVKAQLVVGQVNLLDESLGAQVALEGVAVALVLLDDVFLQ